MPFKCYNAIHINANELIQLSRQFKVDSMQIKLTQYNALMNLMFFFYLFLPSFFFFILTRIQVIEVVRHPHDKAESKYNPDAGISKEDEERYQKLLLENEDLQRLIVQVSGY